MQGQKARVEAGKAGARGARRAVKHYSVPTTPNADRIPTVTRLRTQLNSLMESVGCRPQLAPASSVPVVLRT